jgi:hypothetical protein
MKFTFAAIALVSQLLVANASPLAARENDKHHDKPADKHYESWDKKVNNVG